MNDDVKLIIEQLREPVWGESVRVVNDRLRTAALFLESLATELEQVKQERDGLSIMLTSATSAAETYKRERDAAVEDIYSMKACALCKHYPSGEECETYFLLCIECDNEKCICKECSNGEKMEWRGIKEG